MDEPHLTEYEINLTIRILAASPHEAHDVMNEITLAAFNHPCVNELTADGPTPRTKTEERP